MQLLWAVPRVFNVPATRIELHKSNSPFDQTPRDQAFASKIVGELLIKTIHFPGLAILTLQINDIRSTGLHLVGKLVRQDPRNQVRVSRMVPPMLLVQLLKQIKRAALRARAHTFRSREIEKRHTVAAKEGPLIRRWHESPPSNLTHCQSAHHEGPS